MGHVSQSPLGLFEAHGIELEYMIVDARTLAVRAIADELFKKVAGEYVSDVEDGPITWSNELVLHVAELKTTRPEPTLTGLAPEFHRSIARINGLLREEGACLLPTAMHPWMDPDAETRLWPHENNEVYSAYDRIFGCQGHGWANLQSMHINLPFSNDREFGLLHGAIRALLPLLPAISASSPCVGGRFPGPMDNRLQYYKENQKRVPSIAGQVIPEPVFTIQEYHEKVLGRIYADIRPFDHDEILQDDWLNSRGAIPRFGRQTIEIRVIDIQECPSSDLAIAQLVCAALKGLIGNLWSSTEAIQALDTGMLREVLDDCIVHGSEAPIRSEKYLRVFGIKEDAMTAKAIWQKILGDLQGRTSTLTGTDLGPIEVILEEGTLAKRITRAAQSMPGMTGLHRIYQDLATRLAVNAPYSLRKVSPLAADSPVNV